MIRLRFAAETAAPASAAKALIGALALLLTLPGAASAAYYTWNYSGVGVEAHGTLFTNNTPIAPYFSCNGCNNDAGYQIISIAGERNGLAITGLDPVWSFAGNDNLIFNSTPYLDFAGLAYSIGDQSYTVYFGEYGFNNGYGDQMPSIHGYGECTDWTGNCTTGWVTPVNFAAVDPPAPVPEPSSITLLGLAIGGLLLAARRKDRVKTPAL